MPAEPEIEWTSPDGQRRVIIERQAHGFYRWYEEYYVVEEEHGDVYEYWRHASWPKSGLYSSILDAQNDAMRAMSWLRSLIEARG